MRIEFALCVWSQNARFVVTSHCSRCVLDLVVGVYKDLGPSAPGATAPALLDCRLVVSRSIYIYKFYIFARARCYSFAFTTYYCLVFLRLARCYFTTTSVATCVAAVIRSFYIYLLVLFLTYIYIPLDMGVAVEALIARTLRLLLRRHSWLSST